MPASEGKSAHIPGECPEPDELGRAGWTILHTAAAVFPYKPSEAQKEGMRKFIEGWSQVYACSHCAYHMRKHVTKHPPVVNNKEEASWYVCDMHNKVNKVLGKEEFDCSPSVVLKRWHPSYPNMEDTPTIEDQIEQIRKEEREKKAAAATNTAKPNGGGGGFFSWFGGGGNKQQQQGSEKSSAGTAQQQQQQQQQQQYQQEGGATFGTTSAHMSQRESDEAPSFDPTTHQMMGGRVVPIGSMNKISKVELNADPRTQSRWGDRPVFDDSAHGRGAVRAGWSATTTGPQSRPTESSFVGTNSIGLGGTIQSSSTTGGRYSSGTPSSLVPPLSAEDRAAAAASSSSVPIVPPSATVAGGNDNDADISEIMKKVRSCAVYCPDKDKQKGVSLGGH